MDDLNKKKAGKHARQRPTPAAAGAIPESGAALLTKADGHAPDGAGKPDGAAIMGTGPVAGPGTKRNMPAKAPIAAAVSALPADPAAAAATSVSGRPEAANGAFDAAPPHAGPVNAGSMNAGPGNTGAVIPGPVQDARKPAPPQASGRQGKPDIAPAPARAERVKAVRDRFAVPKDDHATLDALKQACHAQGVKAKKNQLLRVAIGLLREVEPARLAQLVAALPPTTRKKK